MHCLHINLQEFSQCHVCHSSKHFLVCISVVVYEDIWKTFVLDGDFKGNHCSWLKPMGYTFHFSIESFPIHFQQHALLQFQIRTSLRTSSIMFLILFQYPFLAMKMSSWCQCLSHECVDSMYIIQQPTNSLKILIWFIQR